MTDWDKLKEECELSFSRSSGKGGQFVNRVASKAELRWKPSKSKVLDAKVIERFEKRFASKINQKGELLIVSQVHRHQSMNIRDVFSRLKQMILQVLKPPKKRLPTSPVRAAEQERLRQKKLESAKKLRRRKTPDQDVD